MRLEGTIRGVPVVVLVDSGATHNFISPEVVQALSLSTVATQPLHITWGDGHRVLTGEKCSELPIQLNDFCITVEAYLLKLEGLDIILGVDWLKTWGKVLMDWGKMTMSFEDKGKMVELKGGGGIVSTARGMNDAGPLHHLSSNAKTEINELLWSVHLEPLAETGLEGSEHRLLELQEIREQGHKTREEILEDPLLHSIVKQLLEGKPAKPGFKLQQGILLYKNRLVIPAKYDLVNLLLKEFHSSPSEGHSEFLKTYRRIAGNLYWMGMKKNIREFVRECNVCQRQRYSAGAIPFELVDEAIKQLQHNLLRAQEVMKRFADKKRKDTSLEVSDWVLLKLRLHRQPSVARRNNPKLTARFFGPYQMVERIGEVAFKLQLPATSRVQPVFHVSQLKKAVGNYTAATELPPGREVEPEDLFEPEQVLSHRFLAQPDGTTGQQWLVKWKGLQDENATWEDEAYMRSQFPNFSLEDKATTQGGSSVRTHNSTDQVVVDLNANGPTNWKVYVRRDKREDGSVFGGEGIFFKR